LLGEEGDEADTDAPKIYEAINSFQELSDRLEMYQQQYNESVRGAKMDLVFFKVSRAKCLYIILFIYINNII